MAIAYQYDLNGYYVGPIEAYNLLPNNATFTAPEALAGYIPRWNGQVWEQVENHRGETGWLNGAPATIESYGPYPEGWSATSPEPTQAEKDEARKGEILAELARLDNESVRPLRAILHNDGTDEDKKRLAELEGQAAALRAELEALGGLEE